MNTTGEFSALSSDSGWRNHYQANEGDPIAGNDHLFTAQGAIDQVGQMLLRLFSICGDRHASIPVH